VPSAAPHPVHPSSAKSRLRVSALLTHLTTSLLASLAPTINETKSNVERRFSLTAREREQELMEQSKPATQPSNTSGQAGQGDEEEEEERIYNPLKLPLGWDGKPIPYWLYKLHGLGVEYRCEICSDHVYMGRQAAFCLNSGLLFTQASFSPEKISIVTSKSQGMPLECVPLGYLTRNISMRSRELKMLFPVRIPTSLLCKFTYNVTFTYSCGEIEARGTP
jgi:SF3a60/Prp9 C-terminal